MFKNKQSFVILGNSNKHLEKNHCGEFRKDLSYGTNLIRENNKQSGHKTTTIKSTEDGNSTQAVSMNAYLNDDGTEGQGSDAKIEWNADKEVMLDLRKLD